MILIPAIDLKEGRCVRLEQGRMDDETLFSEIPEEMAVRWVKQGAERLHVVDLNGAFEGKQVNRETIKRIVDATPVPVELGGGIRDLAAVEATLELGIEFVILGSAAHRDPKFVIKACEAFPGKIILGIDARQNRVAIEGWVQEVNVTPIEMAQKYDDVGLSAIIYTDIARDGMKTGPNVEATRFLAQGVQTPVIASGGISGISDVKDLLGLSEYGVIGMITGRALYDGSLNLIEAIRLTKEGINK